MNVSKQELDALTGSVIGAASRAQHIADMEIPFNRKDQREILDHLIASVLLEVIDFRDKHRFPALLADAPYRKARQEAHQKEIVELSERLAANQIAIEQLTEHNARIEAKLQQLQKETL